MDIGPSEAETFWTAFLRKLARRGLRGGKLVISDAHESALDDLVGFFERHAAPAPNQPPSPRVGTNVANHKLISIRHRFFDAVRAIMSSARARTRTGQRLPAVNPD